ncbi:MAG: anaerobic ribonucleoside-triphosphate reductase [Eubacteriales bacterium]|nr:anaerobic ribonucleoside-triphosphate reductase [Eubacteriales bacterium]
MLEYTNAGVPKTEERFVIKRSGEKVPFEAIKIRRAIEAANKDEYREELRLSDEQISAIVTGITAEVTRADRSYSVEELQEMVLSGIFYSRKKNVYDLYRDYRNRHMTARKKTELDKQIEGIVEVGVDETGAVTVQNEEVKQENSNKNPTVLSVQRDYMAGEWSRYYTNRYLLPEDIVTAHKEGIIHFHDTDYFAQHMHNCCLVNLEDMLQNGTCISGVKIDTPKSFTTACTVASQIVAQVASTQYGGQTISLSHIAPFVDVSRRKIRTRLAEELEEAGASIKQEKFEELVEKEVRKEVESGCQTIQYQLITLQSTNGQAPFVTIFMYLHEVPEGRERDDLALCIEVMLQQRILGVKDHTGHYITPAFPKLIYVLQEDNIYENTPYFYLTELAAKCTAKRMVPDYISEKIMMDLKGGDVYPCMGCRSFLTPDRFTDAGKGNISGRQNYREGERIYYGRFNQGVVTLNLVDVACSSGKDEKKFWDILEKRLDLCHRALRIRHERLKGTPSDVAPIQWQDGALARLKPGETIDKLLYDGYSTLSLGYAGLAECVFFMRGISHTSEEGKELGLRIMKALNDACTKWKAEENIDYSVYGTPLESTTYKFARCLQKRFGKIPGVTDRDYITNSYHIHVTEKIDAFSKLSKESEFQRLSPGGAISYVEVPNMQNNIVAVIRIMQHIYNTILYAELNTKSDYCSVCGFDGEIQIVKSKGSLVWECPQCGNRDQSRMHVARRTCGYIGTQYWNHGRSSEIADRVLHV